MNGRRDQKVREVLASHIERIVITPSTKSGILAVSAAAYDACTHKGNDRSKGQSCVDMVTGAGGSERVRIAIRKRLNRAQEIAGA